MLLVEVAVEVAVVPLFESWSKSSLLRIDFYFAVARGSRDSKRNERGFIEREMP